MGVGVVYRAIDPIGVKDPDGAGVYPATMGNQELTHRLLNFPYIGEFHNIWEARFFEHDPNYVLDVSAGGTASSITGGALFQTDNSTGLTFTAIMRESNRYASDHTMGYAGTFDFHIAPLGTGEYEFGALDAARENGITIYQTASTIGIRRYFNSTTPVEDIDIADWNLKPGGTGIYKDDNGDGTALDFTKRHILRIVGKWLGSSSLLVTLEPEDHSVPPVAVHEFRFNNRSHDSSLATPNLPMQMVLRTGDTVQQLHAESGCWVVGNDSSDLLPIRSDSNSTTTPAAFTGKFISLIHRPFARVVLDCNVDGDLDISWSDDGNTVVYQEPTFEFDAADGPIARNYAARAEFIKVDFTPASAPTTMRLTTTLTADVASSPLALLKEVMGRGMEVVPTKSANFVLDGSVTRAQTGGSPGDAISEASRIIADNRSFLHGYNGSTWDRVRSGGSNADGVATSTLGIPRFAGFGYFYNGASWDRFRGDVANGLDVDVTRSALPTGAATSARQDTQTTELTAIKTAVQIMDDWDESDRAKVNPIVGQAGVQGGSGVVTSSTQRVVLATDVALPAGTNDIGGVRSRDEDEAFLYHNAGGVTSVSAATWVTLASITVPDGTTLRLKMAEGDLADLGTIGNNRGIRIRQAGTIKATSLTGANQPNPDIEGLVLSNSSGGNETWDLQGRHSSVGSQDMTGWFTWVQVSD